MRETHPLVNTRKVLIALTERQRNQTNTRFLHFYILLTRMNLLSSPAEGIFCDGYGNVVTL
jgi:hypothetical protein